MAESHHINLHHDGDKEDVYKALQRDYSNDAKRLATWDWVIVLCAAGAALVSHHYDWLWLFAAIYALNAKIVVFIDNSNRNWAMHLIDWMTQNDKERDVGN